MSGEIEVARKHLVCSHPLPAAVQVSKEVGSAPCHAIALAVRTRHRRWRRRARVGGGSARVGEPALGPCLAQSLAIQIVHVFARLLCPRPRPSGLRTAVADAARMGRTDKQTASRSVKLPLGPCSCAEGAAFWIRTIARACKQVCGSSKGLCGRYRP